VSDILDVSTESLVTPCAAIETYQRQIVVVYDLYIILE
jgi:hypothetical protein